MPAPSKRRFSYYSLPLVAVIGFLLVVGLATWQRADGIADLADRVVHGEPDEAKAAVRQLAAIPNPPLSILVAASASDEHATAEAAQLAISRLLRRWQSQLDTKRNTGAVANQLARLAEALAEKCDAFPPADIPWLAETTRKILRLANQCPPRKTPLVAMHCDAILAVAAIDKAPTTPIAENIEPIDDAPQNEVDKSETAVDGPESRHARLERDFSAFAPPTAAIKSDPNQKNAPTDSADSTRTTSAAEESYGPADQDKNDAGGDNSPSKYNRNEDATQSTDMPLGQMPTLRDRAWRSDWSMPIFRILPAMPIKVLPAEETTKAAKVDSGSASSNGRPVLRSGVAAKRPRELFERWLAAEGGDRLVVEQELAACGFGRPATRLVEQFLSGDPQDRLRLIDDVLTEPGVDARPWLSLLANDADADVRLLVVTIMATSDDAALVETAWQVAIRDRDPRIADLAGRLRERRR